MSEYFRADLNRVVQGSLSKSSHINDLRDEVGAGFDLFPSSTSLKTNTGTFSVESGSADTYEIAMPVTATSYVTGMQVVFIPTNNNTGPSTLNVDGLGVKGIKDPNGNDLVAEDMRTDQVVELRYNGSNFVFSGSSPLSFYKSMTDTSEATTGVYNNTVGIYNNTVGIYDDTVIVKNEAETARDDILAVNLIESKILASGQIDVVFSNDTTNGIFYLSGDDCDNGRLMSSTDYSNDTVTNTITLTQSYPNGSVVFMAYREDITNVSDLLDNTKLTATSISDLRGKPRYQNATQFLQGYSSVGDGGSGNFIWDSSDLSTEVTADTQSGIYVAPSSDLTGASGAWVRQYSGAVNVKWFGAVGDGVTDDTLSIQAADASGKKYYIPDGTYLFTGSNLPNIQNMERQSENVVFKNEKYSGIIAWDRSGHIIGLHHNHLEEKAVLSGVTPQITSGNIVEPPTAVSTNTSGVDICAFWYQDFGLDSIRDSSVGSNIWYSWEWAHTDAVPTSAPSANQGYEAKRHPLLGWYRGDDQNVLDWQCYWLTEAGVTSIVTQCRGTNSLLDTSTWQNTSDLNNWIYKLCSTVKNAEGLGIIPWVDSGNFGANYGDATELNNQAMAWDANILAIHNNNRQKVIVHSDKSYLTVYMFDGESLRGDHDNYSGSVNTAAFLADRATYAQSLGYDGIAVMVHNPSSTNTMNRGALLDNGVLYFESGYIATASDPLNDFATYDLYARGWTHDQEAISVPGVYCEAYSSNHPSDFTQAGSTASLFKVALERALQFVKRSPYMPKIITLYNVSEWAEGGVSLQPTVGNGWGYLDAVREALNTSSGTVLPEQQIHNFYKPVGSLPNRAKIIYIGSDYNQTFNGFTPFLVDGVYDGQEITIINYEPVSGKTIYIPDDSVTAGSNIFFKGGTSKALPPWEGVTLQWLSDKGWLEK